jgi:cation diffusion facilitator family transporter
MIRLLIKLFTDGEADTARLRTRCGVLSGSVGIVLNILLFILKMIAGSMTGSIAVKADAFNNLSDAAASFVNVFGFKLAGRPADDEHPFGHGRLEYICAMIVTFLIFFMGYELASSSFFKIVNPEPVTFSLPSAAILAATILGKLWLALFNRRLGKKIDSPAISAAAADSVGDMAATAATLVSLILSRYTELPLDGVFGLGVAVFIFVAGVKIFKSASSPLLGQPPQKETVEKLQNKILAYDGIIGVHDLMVHNYGPGQLFGSAHAEVPSTGNIMEMHDTIDLIEQEIKREFGMMFVIHLDPITVDDEHIDGLREKTLEIIRSIDEELLIHDFRVVEGVTHTNLIFDLVTPHKYKYKPSELVRMVEDGLAGLDKTYYAVITVEESYV